MVMSKRSIDRLILNTDWIHEDVQQWLVRELYVEALNTEMTE